MLDDYCIIEIEKDSKYAVKKCNETSEQCRYLLIL
jgi:hypothetical protein